MIAQNLRDGDELIAAIMTDGSDEIVGTKKGKSIRFSEEDVRPMGRSATGVKAITLEENDSVVGAEKVRPGASILSISETEWASAPRRRITEPRPGAARA